MSPAARTRRIPDRLGVLVAAFLVAVLVACGGEPPPATSAAPAGIAEGYAAQIASNREGRNERVRSNWMTLTGLHWLAEGDNRFGSAPDNAIVFPEDTSPAYAGNFIYADGQVFLESAPDAGLTVNGEPSGDTRLNLEPDVQQLGLGRLEFFLIARSNRHAIRVRDPESSSARDFRGIDFYPVDPSYVIEGTLRPSEEVGNVRVETVIGDDTEMLARGTVEFELAGKTHTLEALGSSAELFLMFKDATTGSETYSAGRYLYAPITGNRVGLDFNKAYNPPCAFTPYATCPLPPLGNRMDAPVEAGERAYHPEKDK